MCANYPQACASCSKTCSLPWMAGRASPSCPTFSGSSCPAGAGLAPLTVLLPALCHSSQLVVLLAQLPQLLPLLLQLVLQLQHPHLRTWPRTCPASTLAQRWAKHSPFTPLMPPILSPKTTEVHPTSAPMTNGPGEGMELKWALLVQAGEGAMICVGIPGRGIPQSCPMPGRGGCSGVAHGGQGWPWAAMP